MPQRKPCALRFAFLPSRYTWKKQSMRTRTDDIRQHQQDRDAVLLSRRGANRSDRSRCSSRPPGRQGAADVGSQSRNRDPGNGASDPRDRRLSRDGNPAACRRHRGEHRAEREHVRPVIHRSHRRVPARAPCIPASPRYQSPACCEIRIPQSGIRTRNPSPQSRPTSGATPQSSTSTSPNSPTITFSGFRSRWMTPCACANATASQTRRNTPSRSLKSRPDAIHRSSRSPRTRFIA